MTETAFKKLVLQEIIQLKEQKLKELRETQKNQLSDVNNDDIDYGDTAESPREQLIDEIGQTSGSLDFLASEIETLRTSDPDQRNNTVSMGALVKTNAGYFLVATAQETFHLDGEKITGLSVDAPLFKKMEGFHERAEFHFGKIEYIIQDIH